MSQNESINQNTKRIATFDLLKVFAIYMVLWGHCISGFQDIPASHDCVYRIIYSFHMPLFMMIAGYFSTNSFKLDTKSFITKKFRELLYPVIIWGVIFFAINSIIRIIHNESINAFYDLKAIYIKNLWFLKSAFICYIAAYFSLKKNSRKILFVTLLLSQFVISHNLCIMYPAFCTGIILSQKNYLLNNKIVMMFTFSIFLLMLLFWNESYWVTEGMWPSPNMLNLFSTGDLSILTLYLDKGVYRIIIGLSGSIAIISIFNIYFHKYKNCFTQTAAIWGRYTLGTYIIQTYILEYFLGSYINMNNANYLLFHFIYTPFVSLSLLYVITHIVMLTYNSGTLSILLWGITKKKIDR